jgi:hypothetical protein
MIAEDGRSRSAIARVQSAGGKVRLDYEAGPRRWSVIDDGRNLIWLDPHSQTATLRPRPQLAIDRSLAERNYSARFAGEAVVAGRPARVMEIIPRRAGPTVRRLWLDTETSFVLKRERYNAEGRLTSQTEYVTVEIGAPVAPDQFSMPSGWAEVRPRGDGARFGLADLSRRMGFAVAQPRYIPAGYALLGGYEQEWGRWGVRMAELRYTDGIRLLNVYQRQRLEDRPGHGLRHRLFGDRDPGHRGRGGRGRGRGGGRGGGRSGFGPPGEERMTLVDHGTEKALRYFGDIRVVVVVGDLLADELVRVAQSVENTG